MVLVVFIFFATRNEFLLLRMDRIGTLLERVVVAPPRVILRAVVDAETDEDDTIIDNIVSVSISK
jgi:hypothetical protein